VSKNGGVADFETRLQELYRQPGEPVKERDFMILAKAWNKSGSTHEVTEQRLKNNEVYKVKRSASLVDDGVSSQSEASNLHVRLQNLYEHVEQPEMERAYIELAKKWNSSGGGCGEEGECEDPQILTVLNETCQEVGVKNESRASQLLTI